jgi:hypothetical protein
MVQPQAWDFRSEEESKQKTAGSAQQLMAGEYIPFIPSWLQRTSLRIYRCIKQEKCK